MVHVAIDDESSPSWTFLTNHGHVMILLAQSPDIRLSQIASMVGIGERATHRIVHDLIAARYVNCTKVGRRNVYRVDLDRPLRHPLEAGHQIRAIVEPILSAPASTDEPKPGNR
jgi:DNA-binding IclR family transcriptional regulator